MTRVLQHIRYLLRRSGCFRPSDRLAGWDSHPLEIAVFHGILVYRAYEGVAGVQFDLRRHVGRFALAGGDLLRMALARRYFELVAIYSPAHSPAVELGPAAAKIVNRVEGNPV